MIADSVRDVMDYATALSLYLDALRKQAEALK
jgi:hypothetical protein